ncbi:bifunctional DNA-formamidopyrimidine glycosylase/DNA-(apurinic or apyrimidinic site) lyase [Corynebacterium falsenii]|uniref:bifunctional DNA-formamidopyrimidine glycosylase/DNA-(apurinic or apyrimidinic site) lyase n=1 Tax=Corynebacterium falsenii TaxID=108486 RepID=UPI001E11E81C|nr:bifunctional DNA-formamidopyrimidine glycosylase/DNA-(apurinic or apyrimidinic site) lyase [Corynebacterium falsenii]HJF11536.1 bifunctional DNA-formamidopyrimidine glycosylase/DNA-(apurinic or apyrimidinic site) lyase [Corynebacterium falsenii]
MPELPEVEVVRRGLDTHLVGRTFTDVEVLHPRAVRAQEGGSLRSFLVDATVDATSRRGKYLWLDLSTGKKLYVHLGMSGQMLVGARNQVVSPHVRIRAHLDDGTDLTFVDQRTFGQWRVVDGVADPYGAPGRAAGVSSTIPTTIPTTVAHIAADPLEPVFDLDAVARRIKTKNTEIKRVLLDQTVISGIGNIYADEALFRAGVRPRRRASALSLATIRRIILAAEEVMRSALDQGGTSFDSLYVNVNGASGYFSRSLNVYGQEGRPCRVCGTPIKRVQFMNRSSHYCPMCQKQSRQ